MYISFSQFHHFLHCNPSEILTPLQLCLYCVVSSLFCLSVQSFIEKKKATRKTAHYNESLAA